MTDSLIDFNSMAWISTMPGIRQKVFLKNGQRMRLVEFSDNLVETEWCTKGHIGYVLEGSICIDFDGKQKRFKRGDGFLIPEGEKHKHRTTIAKGEKALIILFEITDSSVLRLFGLTDKDIPIWPVKYLSII